MKVEQNPDKSWTATGGSSLVVVSVTCVTQRKAVTKLEVALAAIISKAKP